MSVLARQSTGARFEVGRVFARVIALLRTHGLILGLASLVIIGLPLDGGVWLMGRIFAWIYRNDQTQWAILQSAISTGFAFVFAVFESLAAAWITLVLVAQSKGDEAIRPMQMVGAVGAVGLAAVANGLIYLFGVIVGAVLLVVPGLFLATAWAVSLPAVVSEGLGPIAAFGRSRDLTRRYPWPVIGCLLLVFVPANLMNYAINKLMHDLAGSIPGANYWIAYAVSPVLRSLEQLVLAATVASIYVELVTLREGGIGQSQVDAFN